MRAPTLFTVVMALSSPPVFAATFIVTHTGSTGPGSLRAMIEAANQTNGAHTIRFDLAANSTIALTATLPEITATTVIVNGANVPGLVIDAWEGSAFRVGETNSSFILSNLTVKRGWRSNGGGCLRADSALSSNATVVVTNVKLQGCGALPATAQSPVQGGAIHVVDRAVLIQDSVIEDSATRHVAWTLPLTLTAQGAALFMSSVSAKTLTINNSRFAANHASADDVSRGGAIFATGPITVTIADSVFAGNQAVAEVEATGGAIQVEGGANIMVENSLFFENHADHAATLLADPGTAARILRLRNNTFVGNFGGGTVTSRYNQLEIRNNSFADSIPINPGGVQHLDLRGITPSSPLTIDFSNNLLLPLVSGNDLLCAVTGSAATVNASHNLMAGLGQLCGPHQTAPAQTVRVEALRENGGPTPTLSLRAGSSAIDAGNPAAPSVPATAPCLTLDARGVSRPQDGDASGDARCDVGAWESEGEAPLFRDDLEPVLWRPAN